MKSIKTIFLISGAVLISIAIVYWFTLPSAFPNWNLSDTGNIGETIGGITAPIFGLLGAVLIYLSFQAQIEANRVQLKKMEEDKIQSSKKAVFENYMRSFDEIKKTINTIEFVVNHITSNPLPGANQNPFRPEPHKTEYTYVYYHGLAAINEYIRILETGKELDKDYDINGMELSFKYILNSVNELLKRLNLQTTKSNENDNDELAFLKNEIRIFYNGFLKKFLERAIQSQQRYAESDEANSINNSNPQNPLPITELANELSILKSEIDNNLL